MSKIDEFKSFVKDNPRLIKYVKNNEMTWQKFYEIYDLYGNSSDAWKDFLDVGVATTVAETTASTSAATSDFMSWIKGIDLDSIREGVNSLQRVIGVMQDFNSSKKTSSEEYKPRPLYKHFED
ncbi:MAG: hypothetical protein HFI86_02470 [Bacilli bacterium]|nr:hypothetical protein [Bacilli bacterium]MCI9434128.1 hypothetical protein [Bacilli bacterium]